MPYTHNNVIVIIMLGRSVCSEDQNLWVVCEIIILFLLRIGTKRRYAGGSHIIFAHKIRNIILFEPRSHYVNMYNIVITNNCHRRHRKPRFLHHGSQHTQCNIGTTGITGTRHVLLSWWCIASNNNNYYIGYSILYYYIAVTISTTERIAHRITATGSWSRWINRSSNIRKSEVFFLKNNFFIYKLFFNRTHRFHRLCVKTHTHTHWDACWVMHWRSVSYT